jgi:acetyl esterase/lipase
VKKLRVVFLAIASAAPLLTQAAAGASDATSTAASMQSMAIPSHGSSLLGVFYLAAGAGPHPTAILFHGFPGYEQNLDLAQAMRAHGWNVLAMHYRGSWGVKGDFSFAHCAEDADTQVQFVLNPENAAKYRVDRGRVIVIGHSMGGFMAASAAAHNKQIAGAVLISAWNIGADFETRRHLGNGPPSLEKEAAGLEEHNNLAPLAGTSGLTLAREIHDHQSALNFNNLAADVAPRPALIITSNEGLAPSDHVLAEAFRAAGDSRVVERHWDTDHSYSGERAALADAILEWAGGVLSK